MLSNLKLMGQDTQISFKSQGLDIILRDHEVRANMEAAHRAKAVNSEEKIQLFAIPHGLLFRPVQVPVEMYAKKNKKILKIDTNAAMLPKVELLSPLLNEGIRLSPAPVSERRSSTFSQNSMIKMPHFTPISPENIRIKIYWNSNDAMAILSHRNILLADLIRQIRSKLQINFDPTLVNHKTGQVLTQDSELWDNIKDHSSGQFQIRINESI